MKELRLPLFILAIVLIWAIVFIERGALRATDVAARLPLFLTQSQQSTVAQSVTVFTPEQQRRLDALRQEKAAEIASLPTDLSGFGVASLQFVDGFLLYTLALMALGLILPDYIQAKVQGVLSVIFAILLILFTIPQLLLVLAKLITMVALFLSFPFGTIAYLIIYGSFPRSAASAVLGFLFFLRLIFGVLLLLAHQRFIENKGLVIYLLVSFIASTIIAFLYGIVPGILVSITDAIAAIVVMIIGIILALILGLLSLLSIILALKPL